VNNTTKLIDWRLQVIAPSFFQAGNGPNRSWYSLVIYRADSLPERPSILIGPNGRVFGYLNPGAA
jgi:hypothetical protein